MATNTYTALRTTTLTSSAATVTLDLTGITGYTDLVLVCNVIYDTTTANVQLYYNGDTGSNYSTTILAGNGSGVTSTRFSSQSNGWLTDYYGGTANEPFTKIIHIMNYANTTTYKTGICRNSSGREAMAGVGLWRSTAAITSLTLKQGGNFLSGSTFTVYGVTAGAAIPTTAKATGGTITYGVDYTYHTFTSSGTFTPSQALSCDYVVVAGGGGGGSGAASADNGGGGGAGGYRTAYAQSFTSGTGYTVTIGAGGGADANGSNSSLASFAATGGGRGGGQNSHYGSAGGSGGGSGNATASGQPGSGNAGGYSPVEGYAGSTYGSYWAGGGGGASATGTSIGGGGDGILTTIGPVPTYYGGGGGGGFNSYADRRGLPGLGNTGYGADYAGQWYGTAQPGTVNAGGGGGGGASQGASIPGASGGSGIVIIRYAN